LENPSDTIYYYVLRSRARLRIAEAISKIALKTKTQSKWNITLASISQKSLDYARLNWPKYYSGDTNSVMPRSWDKLYHSYSQQPSFFDLAIWIGNEETGDLVGMALGRPSHSKKLLSINWIERSNGPTYFDGGVLLPILGCAEEYGKLIGVERIMIRDPVDALEFERYGYSPIKRPGVSGSYLCKELDYETV
jgi:hypothetical protein